MPIRISAGLQDSGTTDEWDAENLEADRERSELIDQHETTDWIAVPDISAAEAGAWTTRLVKVRETMQEGP